MPPPPVFRALSLVCVIVWALEAGMSPSLAMQFSQLFFLNGLGWAGLHSGRILDQCEQMWCRYAVDSLVLLLQPAIARQAFHEFGNAG